MPTSLTTTIGINLGSRYVGIAVLMGNELLEWRVRIIRGKSMLEKFQRLTAILRRLIDMYAPVSVALRKPHHLRSAPLLSRLELEAREFLQQNGVNIQEFTLNQLKAHFFDGAIGDKKKLANIVVARHPILYNEWQREQLLSKPYYMFMIEAVALADACNSQTNLDC